jgi:hypothetical protein
MKLPPLAFARKPGADQYVEGVACALSFRYFLRYWRFTNRETGDVVAFGDPDLKTLSLWEGQDEVSRAMETDDWLFLLKAGKLGFSELACAFDGWRLRWGHPNTRVHLFSYSGDSSKEIFEWVRFGLFHLPAWMQLPVQEEDDRGRKVAGANHSASLKFWAGPEDVRRIVAYNTGKNISIDQTCNHAHLDEFARWPQDAKMWAAIQSTVSPSGSLHIVTRGAGPNMAAKVYDQAKARKIRSTSGQVMRALFEPYDKRPGRGKTASEQAAWLAQQMESYPTKASLWQFAPTTDREALQGDETYVYPQYENPPGRHLVPAHPCPVKDCRRIAVGVDEGGVNPTAMGLWGERASGRRHCYAEFYRQHATDDDILEQLIDWWQMAGKPRGGRMRVFASPDAPTLIATLKAHLKRCGIIVAPANNNIAAGIRTCSRYLNANGMTFHDGCVHHDEEMRDYRNSTTTDRVTRIEYAGERPIKHHADAMEEMRYANLGLSTWKDIVEEESETGRTMVGRR